MRSVLALAFLCAAAPSWAGPIGAADAHAAAPTGFPGAYLSSVRLSLASDPLYGSRFLDAFQLHLQAVTGMTAPRAVAGYLEQAATAESLPALRAKLGREELPPPHAAALLLANALTRPDQFREVMDGLETLKPGMGRHASDMLRSAHGAGDKRLLETLREAGRRRPQGEGLVYGADGRWATMFDGSPAPRPEAAAASAVAVPATFSEGPGALPRRSGLLRHERP